MARAIVLHAADNVATLVDPGSKGEKVQLSGKGKGEAVLAADIPFGHKLATRAIARGEPILKYGKTIGSATGAIAAGEHVHVHNVEALRARGDKREAS